MPLLLQFPGQGSHFPGMGRALVRRFPHICEPIIARADEALDSDLARRVFLDPPSSTHDSDEDHRNRIESLLHKTENAQPAILIHSVMMWEVMSEVLGTSSKNERGEILVGLGHSLGEYSALVVGGAISLEDGVRLVSERGRVMQRASDDWGGRPGMASVLNLNERDARDIISRGFPSAAMTCELAAVNGENQVTLSGSEDGVNWVCAEAKRSSRARRVVPLNVSAPFHTTIMSPARTFLESRLGWLDAGGIVRGEDPTNRCVVISKPTFPMVFNAVGDKPDDEPSRIKDALVRGVVEPVRWSECFETAVKFFGAERNAGLIECWEVGGNVLTRMRHSDRAARWISTSRSFAHLDDVFKASEEEIGK